MRPPPLRPARKEDGRRRIIVTGGTHSLPDWTEFAMAMDEYTKFDRDPIIMTCSYKGTDQLANKWAGWFWYVYRIYHPDADHGKEAIYKRNLEMVKNADALIAFYDGRCTNTEQLIDLGNRLGLDVKVVRVKHKPKITINIPKKKPKIRIVEFKKPRIVIR